MIPVLEIFQRASFMARQVGKTYELAQVCKQKGWTLICGTQAHADAVAREYEINTASIDAPLENFLGHIGPYIFDNYAIERAAWIVDNHICDLERRLSQTKRALEDRERQILHAHEIFKSCLETRTLSKVKRSQILAYLKQYEGDVDERQDPYVQPKRGRR